MNVLTRFQLLLRRKRYLLRDEFNGDAVNPANWTGTDTESKISVTGGSLSFAGGKTSPAWADPALVSNISWARLAGLTIEWQVTPGATNKLQKLGFSDGSLDPTTGVEVHTIYLHDSTSLYAGVTPSPGILTPAVYTAVSLYCRIVCMATGAFYYVSTDNKATWKLIWVDSTINTSPLYAFIESYNAALTADTCKVYLGSVKPATISLAPAAPTLGLEAEEATGALVVGKWYKITASELNHFFTGSAIGDIFRATATTVLDANNKVQNITIATTGLLKYLGDASHHDSIYDCAPTVTAKYQGGIVAHANSATAPSYCLHAYVDVTAAKAYLVKIVNNVTTELIAAAVTYSAGARLRVVSIGTKHGMYYAGALCGTIQTLDVSANYGTYAFGFQTLATDNLGLCAINGGM